MKNLSKSNTNVVKISKKLKKMYKNAVKTVQNFEENYWKCCKNDKKYVIKTKHVKTSENFVKIIENVAKTKKNS